MIRVLLCCGGGFSSSYVAERMKKEIIAKNLSNQLEMEFSPFSLVLEKIDNFDIIICCPHLNIYVKQLLEKTDVQVPIYILPPRMYGNMEIEEIYQDNVLKITRQKAYKHVYQK